MIIKLSLGTVIGSVAIALAGSAHAEDWILLGQPNPDLNLYADRDSANRGAEIGRVNIRLRVRSANERRFVWEFDCKRKLLLASDGVNRDATRDESSNQAMQIACKKGFW